MIQGKKSSPEKVRVPWTEIQCQNYFLLGLVLGDWRFNFMPRELTKRKITIGEDFENDEILTPAKFEFQNAAIDDTVTVAYEVEGNGNGGDIVINCPNPTGSGYFIHFLSPNLPPLEKEIIFLIDKSGSMRKARRMQQAKEAMHNILGQDLND